MARDESSFNEPKLADSGINSPEAGESGDVAPWQPSKSKAGNAIAWPLLIIPGLGMVLFACAMWFIFIGGGDGKNNPASNTTDRGNGDSNLAVGRVFGDVPDGIVPEGATFETGVMQLTGDKLVIEEIELPEIDGVHAIWGSVGRDHRGHIWIGVSASYGFGSLVEFDPIQNRAYDRGSVEGALLDHNLYKNGLGQSTIHTRIVQADDGYLYFASMESRGQISKLHRSSDWGSHLWRIHPRKGVWEHVAASPKALISLSCTGRYVYCLGYYGHVIHQYDIRAASWKTVDVGSIGGHRSRNLISDKRGHVFAPRVRVARKSEIERLERDRKLRIELLEKDEDKFIRPDEIETKPTAKPKRKPKPTYHVELVEYDQHLREIASTHLKYYEAGHRAHGITGLQLMADGSVIFVTSVGYLYRIEGRKMDSDAPAHVEPLGYLHPKGERYVASLFTVNGERYVMGIARDKRGRYDWVTYDLKTKTMRTTVVDLPRADNVPIWRILIYGSIARDHVGRCYIVGTDQLNYRPVAYRIAVP